MSKAHDDFIRAFDTFLDEVGVADAMSVATSVFVSLVVSFAKANDADMTKPININGGDSRDITIHPPKGVKHG